MECFRSVLSCFNLVPKRPEKYTLKKMYCSLNRPDITPVDIEIVKETWQEVKLDIAKVGVVLFVG